MIHLYLHYKYVPKFKCISKYISSWRTKLECYEENKLAHVITILYSNVKHLLTVLYYIFSNHKKFKIIILTCCFNSNINLLEWENKKKSNLLNNKIKTFYSFKIFSFLLFFNFLFYYLIFSLTFQFHSQFFLAYICIILNSKIFIKIIFKNKM